MPDDADIPAPPTGSDVTLGDYASVLLDDFIAQVQESGLRLGDDLKATLAGIAADAERIAASARAGRDVTLDMDTLKARVQNVSLLAMLQFRAELRDAIWRGVALAVKLAAAALAAA